MLPKKMSNIWTHRIKVDGEKLTKLKITKEKQIAILISHKAFFQSKQIYQG